MKKRNGRILYGKNTIDYDLYVMNRKTLEIAVHPDKSVVVKAPESSSIEVIDSRVNQRAKWIQKQITYFDQFNPKMPDRQYVGGEGHLYLGKQYRLKIDEADCDKVLLKNGFFVINSTTSAPEHIKSLLQQWYTDKAKTIFPQMFDKIWVAFNKHEFPKPELKIQKLEKRWGSLSKKGRLTLNTEMIKTPRECVEYVIVHELCHLVHHDHSKEFYQLLERTMPDWIKRKYKLEMALIG